MEIPGGERGVQNKKPSVGGGGGMDIFWNYTISNLKASSLEKHTLTTETAAN